ncbi:MAG TPA: hypothetical protein VE713_01010 [Pyrinomonadaceae bacterium]|nr:hypothetical protein [Pyrinomonadaceae bacterium]
MSDYAVVEASGCSESGLVTVLATAGARLLPSRGGTSLCKEQPRVRLFVRCDARLAEAAHKAGFDVLP